VAIVLGAVRPGEAVKLPAQHGYQEQLRSYIGSLEVRDFALGRPGDIRLPTGRGQELQLYVLSLLQPPYGSPEPDAIVARPEVFTLASIEGNAGHVAVACTGGESAAWLAQWDYTGNPYRDSRPLKRRAFVVAAVDLLMHDALHEQGKARRSDFLGGTLISLAYTYLHVKDVLPAEVRAAYETGLKRMVKKLEKWGPVGTMTDMDLFAAVSLWYAAKAMPDDADVARIAEAYARRLFTGPRFFHPAGYFVDHGCFDTSYNGISLYFTSWAAVISDWEFADQALARAYRLRSHLGLPDPDGNLFGPSHMSSRTSACPPWDQWNWPQRHVAAAMVSDEAFSAVPLPEEPAALKRSAAQAVKALNEQLTPARNIRRKAWKEDHWTRFPHAALDGINGEWFSRLRAMQRGGSPLLRSPFHREETFIREFEGAFTVARKDGYGAVVHYGPISSKGAGKSPYGFGGGCLSAFWTPQTGTVVLGRRRGSQGGKADTFDEWRAWPVHAVSGVTPGGGVFSSARIAGAVAKTSTREERGFIKVEGVMPMRNVAQGEVLKERIDYTRRFQVDGDRLGVRTELKLWGPVAMAELYEVVPVFLREERVQEDVADTQIEFQVGTRWQPATGRVREGVKAIRLTRFKGSVVVALDRPRGVKLSPGKWLDGYQSQVACRNILIDLRDELADDTPQEVVVTWQIRPGP